MSSSPKNIPLPRIYAWFTGILNNDTDSLTDLLANGLPVDVPHPLRHSTALMEATRLGRANSVQWLLEQGAAPAFLCGQPLSTSLHCAIQRHHWEIAHTLASTVEHCAVMDSYAATPLHVLCAEPLNAREHKYALDLANLIIEKNCPLNALDREGTTALHHCIVNDSTELADLLLCHGANPNAMIPDSLVTPLTIAALEKNMEMAQLLLHYGANPDLKTREGATPTAIYPQLNKLLSGEYVASPQGKPYSGRSLQGVH